MTLKPIFEGEEVLRLIPQRTPMVMLDTFYSGTATEAQTGFTVPLEHLFCMDGHLTESGLIEHMAQSASAMAGYTSYQQNEPAPVGFIGEVKKLNICRLPQAGEKLYTRIQLISEMMGVSLVTAESFCGQESVASCQMKIFIQN